MTRPATGMLPHPDPGVRLQPHVSQPLLGCARLWDAASADRIFEALYKSIPWSDGGYQVAGRRMALSRCQCWFSDPGVAYRYHDQLQNAHAWTPLLDELRAVVEAATGRRFNAVLANLYRDGEDRVSWHADDDDDLGPMAEIASLSVGAPRHFCWRPKPGTPGVPGRLPVPGGMLLFMQAPFQRDWEHAVLPESGVESPRVNLTFRQVLAGR
ncbi:alpha-ketoglutarate-dependent dioxygenase AlkB family protein [Nitrogeniibacter aestuarii]|uniref:alpha-ketoglutarate-dependent dioxygenase AlkB family protein n=1 Tax=Nitrogeniibacter aestuarii TaxID=2815343 RepID=UPI001D1212FD|nr:alpha-ketoglutarate-dependent dioxygenase AlkB [Nitrogeniibacter aestuarii]